MHDRLAELRGGSATAGVDLEMGASAPPANSAFMQAFFDDVQVRHICGAPSHTPRAKSHTVGLALARPQEVKKAMSSIRYNIRQIEQYHGECLTAISAEQGRASTERLDELMRSTNGTATQVGRPRRRRSSLRALTLPRLCCRAHRCVIGSRAWTRRIRISCEGMKGRVRRGSGRICMAPLPASLLTSWPSTRSSKTVIRINIAKRSVGPLPLSASTRRPAALPAPASDARMATRGRTAGGAAVPYRQAACH